MRDPTFKYPVRLVPLDIPNAEQSVFREKLNEVPYLLYQAEQISTGEKIVLNKPGGKRNFGKLSRNDIMVFIYNPSDDSLWLIGHNEIKEDLIKKYDINPEMTRKTVAALFCVCIGIEPDDVLQKLSIRLEHGISPEIILKAYKWIWGQEDCNYPKNKGRWMSMEGILAQFDMNEKDCEVIAKEIISAYLKR
jgi:hypothetical protein